MTIEQGTDGAQTNTDTSATTTATTLLGGAADQQQNDGTAEAPAVEQTAEEKAAADAAQAEADAKAEADKVPDEYEDFTAPDGVQLDAEATAEFKALAKELGLSQAKAQQVADLGPKMMAKWQAKQAEEASATVAKWADDTKADKEIGGDKLGENLSVAKKALDAFGTPELKSLLDTSGLGNHPEIIRLLHKAGKAISEDSYIGGQASPPSAKSMYPNSNHN